MESGGSLQSLLNADGVCVTCEKSAFGASVTCFMCLKKFHAVGCSVSSNICTQTFLNSFTPLCGKTGVNGQKPGNFKFVCDICMTQFEQKQARNTSDEFTCLKNQVNKLDKSMADIKQLLINQNKNAGNNSSQSPSIPPAGSTCWGDNSAGGNPGMTHAVTFAEIDMDKSSTSENKSILVIENKDDADLKKAALGVVEKCVIDSNIGVKHSYDNKQGNTIVVCSSDEQRDMLETKIQEALPDLSVKPLNTFLNTTIAVVGFSPSYDSSNILNVILKQNGFVRDFISLKGNGIHDNHIKLLNVKPLKNNPNLSQAVFKVSASLRNALKTRNDKLLVGIRSVMVYERFYVKRCFGCQKYGHISSKCPTPELKVCAKCAGNHETTKCENNSEIKCVNCQRHGTGDTNHEASSSACPVFCSELDRVRNLN